MSNHNPKAYRRDCLIILFVLLSIWFIAGFGCSIIFREALDNAMPNVGHAPFGFWMSQQGSIITFILLLIVYRFWMNRVDAKHGHGEPPVVEAPVPAKD